MRIRQVFFIVSVVLLSSIFLHAETIEGRGASFPNALYKAWAADYFKETHKRVGYVATDSGDGIEAITRAEVDFGGSDMPLSDAQKQKRGLYAFPTAIGAIALVYHLKGIEAGTLKLSRRAAAAIFSGKVRFWDDPLIAKENPALPLPHRPLKVIVRSDASGTTYNLSYFLHHVDADFPLSNQVAWQIPERIEVSSNGELWAQLNHTPDAIGYIDYTYAIRLKMRMAMLENREGKFVAPTVDTIRKSMEQSRWTDENYYYTPITDPKGAEVYPLVASTFIYINKAQKVRNKMVIDFLDWAYAHGDERAIERGYVPIPEKIKADIRAFWETLGAQK